MSEIPYTPPGYKLSAFNCPHCNAYSKQTWGVARVYLDGTDRLFAIEHTTISQCTYCGNQSIWFNEKLLYPDSSTAPPANPDLPDNIINDFEEARSIIDKSPRSASALLRQCIQKLCNHLGEDGQDIDSNIDLLMSKGLPSEINESLKAVRVTGDEAIPPGKIDNLDDSDTATKLCGLCNLIAEIMITQPKKLAELGKNTLPDTPESSNEQDKSETAKPVN